MRASVLTLALIASLSTFAASAQTPPTKPAATKPAAKAPAKPEAAPAKVRPKLMTRDELRECFARRDANAAEAKAIEAADAALLTERNGVLAERDAIQTRNAEINAAEKMLVAENQAVQKIYDDLMAKKGDMSKKELAAAKADYEVRANEVNAKIDPHNTRKKALIADSQVLEAKVDAFNKRKDELSARTDKLGDSQDAWRAECGNRPYNEEDEKALQKEAAAAKKAAGQ
jgi:hypothetical protein